MSVELLETAARALGDRLAALDQAVSEGAGPSREARRAVEQFFSQGLAGSEILDVFAMAGEQRPEISVLSDDFLDDVAAKLSRLSDEIAAVLARYEAQQITSAEVVKELVRIAKELRSQARRDEELGLSREETAFYDVLATRGEEWVDDPRLREIAVELAGQVRLDLAVDWTQRGNLEAKVRSRIKRLLRKHRFVVPVDGGGLDDVAERVFQQARALYNKWPEIEGEQWWA